MAAVRDELKSAIQPLASKYEVSRVETRLIMWMVGTAIALFGLLKAFP
ncbi:MAG: hypothetical protein JNJ73_17615 [Hyphomonadaceae bacterium]|nr:hypothetical protein [Hyphomonadaceae bacterium]